MLGRWWSMPCRLAMRQLPFAVRWTATSSPYRDDHHNPDHLIAHELGHLLAGHLDGRGGLAAGVSADLTDAVRAMNRACAYESHEERVAEAVADLLMAGARQHSTQHRHSAAATTTLRGFGEAMR